LAQGRMGPAPFPPAVRTSLHRWANTLLPAHISQSRARSVPAPHSPTEGMDRRM